MRRELSSPLTPFVGPTEAVADFLERPRSSAALRLLLRQALGSPRRAVASRRRRFDPVRGWFRKTERAVSLVLSRRVFPWIPGADLPCHAQLRRRLVVSEAEVGMAELPAAFDGTRLLLITDVHAGPFLSRGTLRDAVNRLLTLDPDVILLGGDLVTSRIAELETHLPAFGSLWAPLGVFAVLGNHDHYTGRAEQVRTLLGSAGLRVLHNDAAVLRRGGAILTVAGIDDLNTGEPDLDAALGRAHCRAPSAPLILLSHNPDAFPEAARRRVPLVLSGHTHGGQIRIPGLPTLVRMSRYGLDEGRYVLGASQLVVSRGLGVSGFPCRLACPPEAVLLTLRRGTVSVPEA